MTFLPFSSLRPSLQMAERKGGGEFRNLQSAIYNLQFAILLSAIRHLPSAFCDPQSPQLHTPVLWRL